MLPVRPLEHRLLRLLRSRVQLSWPWLVLAGVCLIYLLSPAGWRVGDGDTLMHITLGHWVLQHRHVPQTDIFSYTLAGQPWVAHEWLAGVVMAAVSDLGGLHGVYVLSVMCAGVTLALQMRYLLKHLPVAYALALVLLAGLALQTHLLSRPHVLTWPVLTLWVGALWQAAEKRRVPFLVWLPLMTLWANLHGGFVLGLGLVPASAMLALYQAPADQRRALLRGWTAFGLGAGLASLLNPAGWHALVFALQVGTMDFMKMTISEWMPYHDHSLKAWTLPVLAMAFITGLRMNPVRLICLLGLWSLAFESARFIAVLGLVAPFVLAQPLAEVFQRYATQMVLRPSLERWLKRLPNASTLLGVLLLACALAGLALLTRDAARYRVERMTVPAQALQALRQHGMQGHGIHAQLYGGYLISQGIPVYIDGRIDMYGEQRAQDFLDLSQVKDMQKVEAELTRWNTQWALLTNTTRLSLYLRLHPDWQTVYQDASTTALVRRAK